MNHKTPLVIEIPVQQRIDDELKQLYSIFDIADILGIDREDIAEMVYAPELNKIRSGQVDHATLLSFLDYRNHEEQF